MDPEKYEVPSVILRSKVAVVGDCQVGKSAIVNQFCKEGRGYPKGYIMTLGVDFQVKVVQIPDTSANVELYLFDTSGHEIYSKIRHEYWKGASYIIAVYDVTRRETFENLRTWIKQCSSVVQQTRKKRVNGIVIASKSDLSDYATVTEEEGLVLANEFEFAYFSCSALKYDRVEEPFNFIASQVHYMHNAKFNFLKQGGPFINDDFLESDFARQQESAGNHRNQTQQKQYLKTRQALKLIFSKLDINRDGSISEDEAMEILLQLGHSADLAKDGARNMMQNSDGNQNGEVTLDEWLFYFENKAEDGLSDSRIAYMLESFGINLKSIQ